MRGKIARELRKVTEFDPSVKRTYTKTFLGMRKKKIFQFDGKGHVKLVDREVEAEAIECVDGSRKIYQIMKRRYNNPDYFKELTQLPTKEEENELRATKEAIELEQRKASESHANAVNADSQTLGETND